MSRAYRIKVRESVSKVVTARDHVSTHLELLEVLPADEMAGLLKEQLAAEGYSEEDGEMVKRIESQGLIVSVDPKTGEVTVAAESSVEVVMEGERSGTGDTDWGRAHLEKAEERLRAEVRADLEKRADAQSEHVQSEVTSRLERHLAGLKEELDRAVNKATVSALKRKAERLGQIKEVSEDPAAGSVTIVVEV